jgi:hypothetical protein
VGSKGFTCQYEACSGLGVQGKLGPTFTLSESYVDNAVSVLLILDHVRDMIKT